MQVTDIGKLFIKNDIEYAVDMTAGRGHDSLYILENTKVKKLYAFDIQKESKRSCLDLIGSNPSFNFILASHENIDSYIKEDLDLIVYNLGYLPGADKRVATNYKSTIKSLEKSLEKLKIKGRIIITVYPGHPEGRIESDKLKAYLDTIDPKRYPVLKIDYQNRPNNPPFVYVIERQG